MDDSPLMGIAPQLNEGVDLRTLGLDPHEGFLLAQIDGRTPAGILCDLVAMDAETLVATLRRLERAGVVTWAGENQQADAASVEPLPDETDSDPALAEVVDLSRDERLQILRAERDVATRSYWEILKLTAASSDADIKRAYFFASKTYHPDRYYGRRLGTFADRLETIFKALKVAYDTLRDPEQRRAYAAANPPPKAASAVDAAAAIGPATKETREQKRMRLEARRQQIIEERRSKMREKFLAKIPAATSAKNQKAEEMYSFGVTQLKSGKVFAAAASFKLAMTYAPNNEQYQALFEEANKRALVERARQIADGAAAQVTLGNPGHAAQDYARAFELAPQRTEYIIKACEAYAQAGNVDSAVRAARQAVEASPQRPDTHLMLAEVLEQAGSIKQALEAAEEAQRLDANDARVKKAIKRLRRKRR